MARAGPLSRIHSILRLVFREVVDLTFCLHLAARHAPAHADRSDHEFRLEIHASDGVYLRGGRRRLALRRSRSARLVLVARGHRRRLLHVVDLARYAPKIRTSHLSLCRMSTVAFAAIAILTLAAALAAATLQKLMHAALCFAVMFVGISAFFFLLGAEFVGLVQIFVYIGAVAVLIVFTILLTRNDQEKTRGVNWSGVVVAIAVFAGLIWAIAKTKSLPLAPPQIEPLTVHRIGEVLVTDYVWALQCVGVLLAAALVG